MKFFNEIILVAVIVATSSLVAAQQNTGRVLGDIFSYHTHIRVEILLLGLVPIDSYECSGSIHTADRVITAASCTDRNWNIPLLTTLRYKVLAGATSLNSPKITTNTVIEVQINNGLYDRNTGEADIAVLLVRNAYTLNPAPRGLGFDATIDNINELKSELNNQEGIGFTAYAPKFSNNLLFVELDVASITSGTCAGKTIPFFVFCATVKAGQNIPADIVADGSAVVSYINGNGNYRELVGVGVITEIPRDANTPRDLYYATHGFPLQLLRQ